MRGFLAPFVVNHWIEGYLTVGTVVMLHLPASARAINSRHLQCRVTALLAPTSKTQLCWCVAYPTPRKVSHVFLFILLFLFFIFLFVFLFFFCFLRDRAFVNRGNSNVAPLGGFCKGCRPECCIQSVGFSSRVIPLSGI